MEPYTGPIAPDDDAKLAVYINGMSLTCFPTPTFVNGFRVKMPLTLRPGVHSVKLGPSSGIMKKVFSLFSRTEEVPIPEKIYRVEFKESGHYEVKFWFDGPRTPRSLPAEAIPTKLRDIGPGLFARIGKAWRDSEESERRSELIGLWEPVNFSSQWFMFTEDNAMLRGDGFATKFRWLDDNKIELYAEETDKTVQFVVLSLGEFELILKVGDQSGHFKKGTTITQELRQIREDEYRKRRAESAANFKNVAVGAASVLAAGGFAVLCCGVAVAAASGGGRCRCQWPIREGNYCVNCGYML